MATKQELRDYPTQVTVYVCDSCGKEEMGKRHPYANSTSFDGIAFTSPDGWFWLGSGKHTANVCSRDCLSAHALVLEDGKST